MELFEDFQGQGQVSGEKCQLSIYIIGQVKVGGTPLYILPPNNMGPSVSDNLLQQSNQVIYQEEFTGFQRQSTTYDPPSQQGMDEHLCLLRVYSYFNY